MIGALWQRAQTAAQEALGPLREDARAQVIVAEGAAQVATAKLQDFELTLRGVQQELQAMGSKMADVQAELARTQGESATLLRQIDAGATQRRELQEGLQTAQQRFTHELEQQRLASSNLEERHASAMRRLLLDVDRERVHATKLQKDLAMCQRVQVDQTELHRQQVTEKQVQAEELRQRNGELEGSLAELRWQREQLLKDMADERSRLESKPEVKKVRTVRAPKMLE